MTSEANPRSEEIEMQHRNATFSMGGEIYQQHHLNHEHHGPPGRLQQWRKAVAGLIQRMDDSVGRSPVGRLFRLKGSGHVSRHQQAFANQVLANTNGATSPRRLKTPVSRLRSELA
jgi:hypothetical protein